MYGARLKIFFFSFMRTIPDFNRFRCVGAHYLRHNCIRAHDTRVSNFPWHHHPPRGGAEGPRRKLARDGTHTLTRQITTKISRISGVLFRDNSYLPAKIIRDKKPSAQRPRRSA